MPNRHEPLTFSMGDKGFSLSYGSNADTPNDSLEAALTDWFILAMQTGMRKSEWCQDRYLLQKTGKVILNRDGSASAFLFSDFVFEQSNGYRCNNSRLIHIQSASLVKICWRFQKNGTNGEILSYMANN